MRNLVYRPNAVADLEESLGFIAKDNPARAATFVEELRDQCRKLTNLPGTLGRPRPELHPELRSFSY